MVTACALALAACLGFASIGGVAMRPFAPPSAHAADGSGQPFSAADVLEMAERLAQEPYVDRQDEIPQAVRDLTYDQYRDVRVRPEAGIKLNPAGTFALDTMPAGFVYNQPVAVFLVEDGRVREVKSTPETYAIGAEAAEALAGVDVPFSGIRLRHPINTPGVLDEIAVFQGATYFRAVGRGNWYGVSARGLAIDTGEPSGEEFPVFRAFWVETVPDEGVAVVVHALLDSPSTTGAYRFTVRPGEVTTTDVELTLFPRTEIANVGFAPFSSMFLFDAINRSDFFDYREAVHDSDGLSIQTGAGEWIWRPLDNPQTLQVSAFQDSSPRGFGLIQRKRDFADFEDGEARYHLRPSVWVEPIGDWGQGSVTLFEIPSRKETNDNAVAYWRPQRIPVPGEPFQITYRVHWGTDPAERPPGPTVVATRVGQTFDGERIQFVVDYALEGADPDSVEFEIEGSGGTVGDLASYPIPTPGTLRVAFAFEPGDSDLAEFRLRAHTGSGVPGESWFFRWTP